MSGWGKELANTWTNNVAPSRPSHAEMCIYTKYLRKIQEIKKHPIKLLILGSTPEFRDWGYDENLIVHVVDKSQEYYDSITREIRHKNLREEFHLSEWENMCFNETFDIIIGDLAIGNVTPEHFDKFLSNVSASLSPSGLFIGKSFLWDENEPVKDARQIVDEYLASPIIHPYSFINHQLGLLCLDKENRTIEFEKMFQEISNLHQTQYISDELFSFFTNVGWNTEMKFSFFAPSKKDFINEINKYLSFVTYEYTDAIYSNLFPVYVAVKNNGGI